MKHSQETIRRKCKVKIPRNQHTHEGLHECNADHKCNIQCPYCEYYESVARFVKWNGSCILTEIFQCNKSYGHTRSHNTAHGSMKPMAWIGISETFQYERQIFTDYTGIRVYCHTVRCWQMNYADLDQINISL